MTKGQAVAKVSLVNRSFLQTARFLLNTVNLQGKIEDFIVWPLASRVLGLNFERPVVLPDGLLMLGTMQDALTRSLLFHDAKNEGVWEPETTRLIRKLSAGKDLVVFGGAHVGYHALQSALAASGLVVAFEPNPELFEILRKNVQINRFLNNIRLEQRALGDRSGLAEMWMSNLRSSLVRPENSIGAGHPQTVEVVTLDEYLAGERLPEPGLVVLDVEGYESKVLEGAKNTIFRQRLLPELIFEVSPRILGNDKRETLHMRQFLRSLGYRLWAIIGDHPPRRPTRAGTGGPIVLSEWSPALEENLSCLRNYNVFASISHPASLGGLRVLDEDSNSGTAAQSGS